MQQVVPSADAGWPRALLQAPLGQLAVTPGQHVVIGRGTVGVPDDPKLSRQHALVAVESGHPTLTWMAKHGGRVRACNGRCSELQCGSQVRLAHDDVITLLGESGRHVVVVQLCGAPADWPPLRPSSRAWGVPLKGAMRGSRLYCAAKRTARSMDTVW